MRFLLDHDVPEDLTYLLEALGHEVWRLRDLAEPEALDADVLRLAHDRGCILLTCNRDDFLLLAGKQPHQGIIIVIRRRTRAAERAALFKLLDTAGETGLASEHQLRLKRRRAP